MKFVNVDDKKAKNALVRKQNVLVDVKKEIAHVMKLALVVV